MLASIRSFSAVAIAVAISMDSVTARDLMRRAPVCQEGYIGLGTENSGPSALGGSDPTYNGVIVNPTCQHYATNFGSGNSVCGMYQTDASAPDTGSTRVSCDSTGQIKEVAIGDLTYADCVSTKQACETVTLQWCCKPTSS